MIYMPWFSRKHLFVSVSFSFHLFILWLSLLLYTSLSPSSRLGRIEQFAGRVRSVLQSAGQDPTAHLSDPVNAYQLVNRFINGWANLHDDIYDDNSQGLSVLYMFFRKAYSPYQLSVARFHIRVLMIGSTSASSYNFS